MFQLGLVFYTQKLFNKIIQLFRKRAFKEAIACSHNSFTLVGKVNLINRNLKIGKRVTIYPDVMFYGDGLIEIGDNVTIGNGTILYASKDGGIKIGNNVQIAAQCYIIDTEHGTLLGTMIREQPNSSAKIEIEDDVWIASNCTILKGSSIGSGGVIGAKSLTKGEYPANSISVGIPAKVIKYRSND